MIPGVLFATIALVGGTVWPGEGPPLQNATVLIENDRIVDVGTNLVIPDGAQVYGCQGMVITPGLVDAYTQLGLVEISSVGSTNDTSPKHNHPIRARLRAADGLNPNSEVLPHQIAYGILSAGVHLSGGLMSGQVNALNLSSGRAYDHFIGVNLSLGGMKEQSRAHILSSLHIAFEQAGAWLKTQTVSKRPEQLPARDLQVLAELLKGNGRLFVRAQRQSDIEQAIRLGETFGIRVVIVGGREAWRISDQLAARNVAVIVNPVANAPTNFDSILLNSKGLSILVKKGVKVAISTMATHQVRKLRQWAGNAVRDGLAYEAAIDAITVIPAALLGLPDRKGIKTGQIADLIVWTGDPLELSSFPHLTINRGTVLQPRTRQKALFRRYRCSIEDRKDCKIKP